MPTGDLVKTYLAYPEWPAISICRNFQEGYNLLRSVFNGFMELEKRPDALDILIAKYKSIKITDYDTAQTISNLLNYGGYDYFTYCLEIITGQYAFLEKATIEQKIELLSELFKKQDFREKRISWFYFEGPAFIMARLMYLDNYQSFMEYYNSSSRIQNFVTWARPIYEEHRTIIISYAKDYFNLLKTQLR